MDSCLLDSLENLAKRQHESNDTLKKFLDLVQSPFRQSFTTEAFFASLGTSLGISAAILLGWCLIRPYNTVVYAPKLRHADDKRAPPQISKGWFSWFRPLIKCHESDLVDKIGLDAIVFLRFLRMCRTIFFFLGLIGCLVMIPVNVSCNLKNSWSGPYASSTRWFILMSPYYAWGTCMWAHVCVAWLFDFIIMYFLWRNYKAILKLRQNYFESDEYQASTHSKTLMITDIPKSYRSDGGIDKIIGGLSIPDDGDGRSLIGRNVKDLPELIEEHATAVKQLESYLAKYLKNPDNLPPTRPLCKPSKKDKSMRHDTKVDAIEYYGGRIKELEDKIKNVRETIDSRDALQYGFVSYPSISRAHVAAKAARGKHPKGTSIMLAPRSNDIIWDNLTRPKSRRRWNSFIGNVLFIGLSVLYVVPNALIAVFLSNLHNIAALFPEFGGLLIRNSRFFAVVQGFAAPTITSIVYLLLPIIMRRISQWQGDLTKSSRERHVTHKLYIFFVLNNLVVFALFGTMWTTIQGLVETSQKTQITWDTIQNLGLATRIALAIFEVSTFWITYLLQRNLGALLDLAQIVSLIGKGFQRHFMSPTPREKIEWTAPPPFDYATYYNYFLFYATIALGFSTIQPLVLPVAFLYFLIDSFLKKYLLMYIFVTKVESGGAFWRFLFNRFLFAAGFFNVVVALVVWVRHTYQAAMCVLPLLFILIGFKFYCRHKFDGKIRYHTKGSDRESLYGVGKGIQRDHFNKRYGHPALNRRLITPMVDAKARHVLAQIYSGRINSEPSQGAGGINLDNMHRGDAGRRQDPFGGRFEIVEEADMDFQHFRHRAEFAEDHGGSIYGAGSDTLSDRGYITPHGFGSPASSRPASPSALGPRRGLSPLPLGGGYRGADYAPVPSTQHGPPSPGFRHGHRPESPYMSDRGLASPDPITDYGHHDTRSETESVRHLLGDQQHYEAHSSHSINRPGSSHLGYNPDYPEQYQQESRYDGYDGYRGHR
ncbi:hypothetical protein HOY80DRAFT_1040774 [Tuber brumale]|nr:hypothetical protein HOY80DRAFT_1040774 [Tuber brumale]